MEWINIHTSTLDSEEMADAELQDHSTWLFLMRYCFGQENGGRICGAKKWPERKWTWARLTRAQVDRSCGLWKWDGDDLLVAFYPIEKEIEVKKKREGAAHGGRMRGKQLRASAQAKAEAKGQPKANAEAQRKGKEGKGKEEKEEGNGTPDGDSLSKLFKNPSLENVIEEANLRGIGTECAEKFFWENEKTGWDFYHEKEGRDWRAGLRSYHVSWRGNEYKKNGRPGSLPSSENKKPADESRWWTDPLEDLHNEALGLAQSPKPENKKRAARLMEIIAERRKGRS